MNGAMAPKIGAFEAPVANVRAHIKGYTKVCATDLSQYCAFAIRGEIRTFIGVRGFDENGRRMQRFYQKRVTAIHNRGARMALKNSCTQHTLRT
jgi:hypothetical protein